MIHPETGKGRGPVASLEEDFVTPRMRRTDVQDHGVFELLEFVSQCGE